MLSTTMAVGFIPCGVLFCSSSFPTLSLAEIPYDTIVIILLEGVAGLGVGMAFRKFKEHWADNFVKVGGDRNRFCFFTRGRLVVFYKQRNQLNELE